jgi:phospholipid transport system substrate-binding protein
MGEYCSDRNSRTRPPAAGAKRLEQFGQQGLLFAATLLLFLALAPNVAPAANGDKEEVARFLQQLTADTNAVLADETLGSERRQQELGRLILAGFDVEGMCRVLLAKHWQAATPSERAEFRRVFSDYMLLTFGRHLDSVPHFDLEIVAARHVGENVLVARSNLTLGEDGGKLYIDWRMRRVEQGWRILDVKVQGISFVKVLRSEFVALIDANDGKVESLLSELRRKTERLYADAG